MDENADGGVVTSVATENATSVTVSDDRFEVAGGNLKLKDGTALDFESDGASIDVTITASGEGASAEHTVSVSINDVDEAPSAPQVRGDLFDVDENAGGVAITSLSDSTDPEGDAVTYAVDDDRFEITAGLVLRVKDDAVLDHEAGGSVDIMLTAMDPAGNVSEATVVTITINDVNEAPSVSVADGAVDENDAGASVGAVTGTDEDGDTLTYSVNNDYFEVVGGMLKLKDGMSLDHETADSVTVTVTATDPDGLSYSTEVTVTVNDVNETFMLEVADGDVDENDAGATVGSVAVSGDPDDGDTHTYAVNNDSFEVVGGMLKLKDDAMLDHEAADSVMVTVTATDSGGNEVSENVMVTVNDVNEGPSFARSSYAFNLSENQDGSTTAVSVGMVSGDDPDDGDTLSYSITGGDPNGLFAVDSSGAITYVGTGEDYRSSVTGPSHTLTVTVSDGDGASAEASVAITILNANDAPMFGASNYAFDLAENADGSTTAVDVGMVSASDSDEGDAVSYSITAGNDDGLFAIDSASGAITYVGSGEDAETTASHMLTVSASDGSASTEAMVTVTVTNANDSAPMFGEESYAFDLAENADGSATAVAVGMVSATDSDGDTLEYSITAGNDGGLFAIDSATGAITYVGMGENYESATMSHELTVSASDGSNSATATVAVSVTDANDAPMADAAMMIDTLALVSGEAGSLDDVDLAALFSDEDGDSLTFSLAADAPDWLTLSVTRSGDAVTGSIGGTPPAGDMAPSKVTIVATDPEGATGEASFYLLVDAANDVPDLTLRRTENGVTRDVTAATVTENVMGDMADALGMVVVDDEDNAMHPHGQHTYTFMINGAATDKFEVGDDGMLRLKADQSLNYEDYSGDDYDGTDGEFTLTVTVTDGGEGSASLPITVTVTDAADGPVAGKIGNWWVVVDDRLDAEDAGEGEWLSFGLDTSGDDAAFTDPDGSDLSYSITVTDDSDDSAVDWLDINPKTGAMFNVEGKVPDAGVYTVMVTASDGDSSTPDASTSFKLAVALSDSGHRDNDEPDIRDVEETDYTEGSGSQTVATFTVRDDDLEIAPHPYGTLEVTFKATQDGTNVKNRFKLEELKEGDDGYDTDPRTAQYKIVTKSAAELAVDDKGKTLVNAKGEPTPIKPINYEDGDEVDFMVTVKDGKGLDAGGAFRNTDTRDFTVDIVDADDEAPVFVPSALGATKDATDTKMMTSKLSYDQQQDKVITVVKLTDLWTDADTDVDELTFSANRSGLPDWVTLYGPDEWEDIERRRGDEVGDRPSGVRDRDEVIVLVVDRSKAPTNASLEGASFTLTASDGTESVTETINISVKDINVPLAETDTSKAVTIGGDPDGTGSLTMTFNEDLDPDFAGKGPDGISGTADDSPVLVLYTWTGIAAGTDGELGTADDVETVISVSTSPQPLPLLVLDATTGRPTVDGSGNVTRDYAGERIKATVQYYEMDPEDGTISVVSKYASEDVAADSAQTPVNPAAPAAPAAPTSVSLDVTTSTSGLAVVVTATGDATGGSYRWQKSEDGSSFTSLGAPDAALSVDENGDGTAGDGDGRYYRVAYTYQDADDNDVTVTSDAIQLGDVTTDPGTTTIVGNAGTVGNTIQINPPDAAPPTNVQWQMRDADANPVVAGAQPGPWMDIEGATGNSLAVTSAHTGKELRAKLTYKGEDDTETPNVDEGDWVTWVANTALVTGPAAPPSANNDPVTLQATHEVRVNLDAIDDDDVQPAKVQMDSVKGLFFDANGDDLTYTITAAPADNGAGTAGARVLSNGEVYRDYATTVTAGTESDPTDDNLQQTLTLDKDTGALTYITGQAQGHDGTDTDGTGNVLAFTITASDGEGGTDATATVNVRINVAPTAINFSDGTTTAADLSTDDEAPTAITVTDADTADAEVDDPDTPEDETTSDPFTVAENVVGQAAVNLGAINVMDQNLNTDAFGTHEVTVSDDRFEVREEASPDGDGSTWVLWLKEGETFNYEADGDKAGTLTLTITATDGGGLKTVGYVSIQISDVDEPSTGGGGGGGSTPKDPTTPGLEDDSDDSDDDGAIPLPPEPPGGTGMFIEDDMLDAFVLAIDDIDIA